MSQISAVQWIWKDGELIEWGEARTHVLSHAVQFGSSIFEGIRCYSTPDGPAVFRLHAHLRRLFDSCRVYRTELPYTMEALVEGCLEVIRANELDACYLRPMLLRGYGAVGMVPFASPVEVYLVCWPWGTYLGEGALENGVDACISSWSRPAPNSYPAMAKVAGNYLGSQLAKMEAMADGYAEAIALTPEGVVSEGTGQNLFLVRDGIIWTPPLEGTLLPGITRDSVIQIARDEGLSLQERPIPREMLYMADELFFTGTAAEVTPIRSVDRITIGSGVRGPVTERLQRRYLEVAEGRAGDDYGWLTPVRPGSGSSGAR